MTDLIRAAGSQAKWLIRGPVKSWRRWRERLLTRKFNKLYYNGPEGQGQLFDKIDWLGVTTLKCPLDLWVYQELLFRTMPEYIVETGTKHGGSALYLASICDLIGTGTIISVDTSLQTVAARVRTHPRIELLEGSSTSSDIYEIIRSRCNNRRTMVVLDSDHRAEHVREELRLYAPLVTTGCYLICEDTNINGHPAYPTFGPGPYEAVQEFLAMNRNWKVDKNCEKLMITFNPSGYLLREESVSRAEVVAKTTGSDKTPSPSTARAPLQTL
jgi:cephalosporin hydroxylase